MKKKTNDKIRNMGAVMAAGGTAVMIAGAVAGSKSSSFKFKKSAAKAIKTVESVIGGMQDMLG